VMRRWAAAVGFLLFFSFFPPTSSRFFAFFRLFFQFGIVTRLGLASPSHELARSVCGGDERRLGEGERGGPRGRGEEEGVGVRAGSQGWGFYL
jgi:hypothetical protein